MILCQYFFKAGANVNAKRFDGNTPLHIGCGRANVGMVALLMAGGADPHVENEDIEESMEEKPEEKLGKKDIHEEQRSETDQDVDEASKNVYTSKDATNTQKVKEDLREKVTDGGEMEQRPGKEDKNNNNNCPTHSHKGLTPADFAGSNEKVLG